MKVAIQIAGYPDGRYCALTGEYVKVYDPEAHEGRGYVETTLDPKQALKFDNSGEARELWAYVPRTRPLRDDGQPNRPLTAFSVEIVGVPDVVPEGGASAG